ncbi:hypothetical protein DN752_22535 [Echinicola strongylocentroti]|uniref:BT-3987-like N-terminal domain-containing protein n=1 Tax=Echinicola strongylocentroti TaxID=1795355 RepID=A0A2Z4IPG8_9BACT|nr:DUF1735 domain-containing protein [Echinicola strongylocentroti]AWW32697.1 hypothetical protein DN752_22535 [Echinicola strongylocentroti]
MMRHSKIYIGIFLLLTGLFSCEPYEDYLGDFDYSIVYFGTQKPLRTIVAYDNMEFKVGVALGGKRSNEVDEYADFSVDPSLLDDDTFTEGNDFELLPADYYSLSNDSRMVIPAGKFIGDVTVTLDREAFTSDPKALSTTYALPIRITGSSLDSISSGNYDEAGNVINPPKDYTILVVKYISPYHGTYYHKGTQQELDENGELIEETVYNNDDLSKNGTWALSTVDRTQVMTPALGDNISGSMVLNVNESNNEVAISTTDDNIVDLVGTATYNADERTFYLDYSFTRNARNFTVQDTLVLRRAPELDLGFEEW